MTFIKNKNISIRALYFFIVFFLFVLLINIFLFNSKVYFKILQPKSSAGRTHFFSTTEKVRTSNPSRDIIVLGDSRIEFGFSDEISNSTTDKFHFLNAGIAGTASRVWYYLLREMDPRSDRYRAIILTFSSFSDRFNFNENNRDDIRYLVPLAGIYDTLEIAFSYDTKLYQVENALCLLLKGFALQGDILEFLQNPKKRIDVVGKYNIAEERKNYRPTSDSLNGIYYDSIKNSIIFPNDIPEQEKFYISRDYSNQFDNILLYNIRYNLRWLNKIIEFYTNSNTLIILAKIPCVPLYTGRQNLRTNESSSLLDIGILNSNKVIILPDELFNYLEKPEYFRDHIHLNRPGRELFSRHIASTIVNYLSSVTATKQASQ